MIAEDRKSWVGFAGWLSVPLLQYPALYGFRLAFLRQAVRKRSLCSRMGDFPGSLCGSRIQCWVGWDVGGQQQEKKDSWTFYLLVISKFQIALQFSYCT